MTYHYNCNPINNGRFAFKRTDMRPNTFDGPVSSGPIGFGDTPKAAQLDWVMRMRRAGLTDPTIRANPVPVVPDREPRTAPGERRTRFYIVRNGDCFQLCNDERFTGTPIAPYAEKQAAIDSALKDSTENREMRCVYEVRLVGTTEPRDAQFKPVAVKPARKATRKAKRS